MIIFLYSIFVLFFITILGGLVFVTKRCLELMEKFEEIGEKLDDAVSILNEQHEKIDLKTKIEVFSDEPIIKDLIRDIAEARDAVKSVSEFVKDISTSTKEIEEEKNEKNKQ